jgi:hypothetical protein
MFSKLLPFNLNNAFTTVLYSNIGGKTMLHTYIFKKFHNLITKVTSLFLFFYLIAKFFTYTYN